MAAIDLHPPPRPLSHSRARSTDARLSPLLTTTTTGGGGDAAAANGLIRSHATSGIDALAGSSPSHDDHHDLRGSGPRKFRRLKARSSLSDQDSPVIGSSHQLPSPINHTKSPLYGIARQASDEGDGSGSARGLSTDFGTETNDEDYTDPDHDVIETDKFVWGRDPRGRRMVNQYVRIDEIGRGVHGKVWLCEETNPQTGEAVGYCAMKEVYREDKRLRKLRRQRMQHDALFEMDEKVRQEIAIMKRCNHPHIVRLKEVINDRASKKIFMVLEYMAGGQIAWRGIHGEPLMTVDEARRTFRDVVLGLEYLHFQGIIHRDIKPANLLWDKVDPVARVVKISDFGVSHVSESFSESADDESLRRKTAGSPAFFAPELCSLQETPAATPIAHRAHAALDETRLSSHSGNYFASRDLQPGGSISPGGGATPSVRSAHSEHRRSPSPHHRLAISKPLPPSLRSAEHKKRSPVNRGIDIWALGVTLYCLLFGTTPFVASNEYELFNIIPSTEIVLPDQMGIDRAPVYDTNASDEEQAAQARETYDLLARLLEKDPMKRITLREVKAHPWVLRNLPDPASWIRSTDVEANNSDSPIHVTTEEVAAATKPRLADDELAKPKGGRTAALVRATNVLGLKHLSKRLAKAMPAPTPQPVASSAAATPMSTLSPQRSRSASGTRGATETHLVRGLLERIRGGSKTPRAAYQPRRTSASTEDDVSAKEDAIFEKSPPAHAPRHLSASAVEASLHHEWPKSRAVPRHDVHDDDFEHAVSDDASDDSGPNGEMPLAWANSRNGWSFSNRRRGSPAASFGEADAEVEDGMDDLAEQSADDEDVEISIRGRSAQLSSPARTDPPSPNPNSLNLSRNRATLSPIPSRSGSM